MTSTTRCAKPFGPWVLLIAFALSACGSGGRADPPPQRGFEISPRMTSLPRGGTARFTGTVGGVAVSDVQWSASAGTITAGGVYTAPDLTGRYVIHGTHEGAAADAVAEVVDAGSPGAFHATAITACAGMPLRTTGTVYHFCECSTGAEIGCKNGDDSSYATHRCSAEYPCRSWKQAIAAFNAMEAGDTIALCKGGAWAVTSTAPAGCHEVLANPRCTKGANLTDPANTGTCDIRDYTASWGGTSKPLLAASTTAPTRILAHGGGPLNGVRILNLAFRGGNNGPNGGVYNDHRGIITGTCNPSDDSDWLICNNSFDRLYIGINTAEDSTASYNGFLVWGNSFTMHDLDAMLLGGGSNNRIDANFFDNDGGFVHPVRGNQAHTIYLSGNWLGQAQYASKNISIVNNEFRRSGQDDTPGPSATPTLVGHEMYDGVNIENNLIDCGSKTLAGCWAITLSAAQTCPTYYRNMTIRRNWINAGGVGINVGQAPGVTIENNVITLLNPSVAWKQGIITPADTALPASFYGAPIGDDVQNDSTVRSNTVYITGANSATHGITVGREGTGHVIANNVVYSTAGTCFSTQAGHCSVTTAWRCDDNPVDGRAADGSYTPGCPSGESCVQDSTAYSFIGNNACSGGAAWGTTYDTTVHVTSDPLFTAAPTDLTPAAGSPLVGAGNATYAPRFDLDLKPRGAPPAIGACEPR